MIYILRSDEWNWFAIIHVISFCVIQLERNCNRKTNNARGLINSNERLQLIIVRRRTRTRTNDFFSLAIANKARFAMKWKYYNDKCLVGADAAENWKSINTLLFVSLSNALCRCQKAIRDSPRRAKSPSSHLSDPEALIIDINIFYISPWKMFWWVLSPSSDCFRALYLLRKLTISLDVAVNWIPLDVFPSGIVFTFIYLRLTGCALNKCFS